MFERNRFTGTPAIVFSVAIFLLAIAWIGDTIAKNWSLIHEANAAYQQNAEEDRRQSAIEIADTCYDRPIDDFRACVGDNLESHYRDQATNEDLQAQQDMAFWAFWLLVVSVFGILVSLLGVILLVRSLGLGREANKEATRAANAANRANEIMREQYRPWVVLERKIGCEFNPSRDRVLLKWNNKIENIGKNPAFSVRTHFKIVACNQFSFHDDLNHFIRNTIKTTESSRTLVSIFPNETPD